MAAIRPGQRPRATFRAPQGTRSVNATVPSQVQGFVTVRLVKRTKSLVLRVITVTSW